MDARQSLVFAIILWLLSPGSGIASLSDPESVRRDMDAEFSRFVQTKNLKDLQTAAAVVNRATFRTPSEAVSAHFDLLERIQPFFDDRFDRAEKPFDFGSINADLHKSEARRGFSLQTEIRRQLNGLVAECVCLGANFEEVVAMEIRKRKISPDCADYLTFFCACLSEKPCSKTRVPRFYELTRTLLLESSVEKTGKSCFAPNAQHQTAKTPVRSLRAEFGSVDDEKTLSMRLRNALSRKIPSDEPEKLRYIRDKTRLLVSGKLLLVDGRNPWLLREYARFMGELNMFSSFEDVTDTPSLLRETAWASQTALMPIWNAALLAHTRWGGVSIDEREKLVSLAKGDSATLPVVVQEDVSDEQRITNEKP
jgi:hypothetical protein